MALKSADPIEVDIAERKMKLMMLTPVDLDPQPRTEAVVCVPPAELLQEPEFMARALWEGMAIMRPWDEIPAEVLAMEPQIVPNEATKDGTLNDEQKEILQEVQALVDIAEFMHYWSRRGCTLELESEYHD
ncbi:hypothetical protein WJX75_008595 [Coccomyxa subellipsoidea]|uniref:Tail assembly chaperone n=1 Tax=Coccomyxa subellipsoidea TaxID=248742 RepID=A0ABR2Z0V1_9CHLO